MQRTDSLEKTLMLGKTEGRRRRGMQRIRCWMASPTWWTWVWASCRSWWWCTAVHGISKSWTWLSDWTKLNWLCFGCINQKVSFREELLASIHLCLLVKKHCHDFMTKLSRFFSGRNVHSERASSLKQVDKPTAKIFLGTCCAIHGEKKIRLHSLWSEPAYVWFGATETSCWLIRNVGLSWLRTYREKGARLASLMCVLSSATLNSSPILSFGCFWLPFGVRTVVWKCLQLDCLFFTLRHVHCYCSGFALN